MKKYGEKMIEYIKTHIRLSKTQNIKAIYINLLP